MKKNLLTKIIFVSSLMISAASFAEDPGVAQSGGGAATTTLGSADGSAAQGNGDHCLCKTDQSDRHDKAKGSAPAKGAAPAATQQGADSQRH